MTDLSIEIIKISAIILSVVASVWALGRRQEQANEAYLNVRFDAISESLKRLSAKSDGVDLKITELERDLRSLQVELPEKYVRREDYIRGQTVLESKLDALALRIENLQLRGQA